MYVLDPCCGTGAYLVEVLQTIATTLMDKGEGGLLAGRLKAAAIRIASSGLRCCRAVCRRPVAGWPVPPGSTLDENRHERAAVLLTNALTGWEPPTAKQRLLFLEMEEERKALSRTTSQADNRSARQSAVQRVRRVAVEEERALVDAVPVARRRRRPSQTARTRA